jgi:hypothetical protein
MCSESTPLQVGLFIFLIKFLIYLFNHLLNIIIKDSFTRPISEDDFALT